MDIEKTIEGKTVLLRVSGELTALTAEKLGDAVEHSIGEATNLVMDFKDLEYVASAGLRIILKVKKKMAALKGSFIIRHVSPDVMQVFEITGFNNILDFE